MSLQIVSRENGRIRRYKHRFLFIFLIPSGTISRQTLLVRFYCFPPTPYNPSQTMNDFQKFVLTLFLHKDGMSVRELADLARICPQTIYTFHKEAVRSGRIPDVPPQKYHHNKVRIRKRARLAGVVAAAAAAALAAAAAIVVLPIVVVIRKHTSCCRSCGSSSSFSSCEQASAKSCQ